MNTSAEVVLKWGDGEYLFALKGKQIEHLEKACEAGIGTIAARLFAMMPFYADIRETVHQGLIGGGMAPVVATEKMRAFFDGQPLARHGDPSSPMATARAIMQVVYLGMSDLDLGEAAAGAKPATKQTSQDTAPPS